MSLITTATGATAEWKVVTMLSMYLSAMRLTGLADVATIYINVNLEEDTPHARQLMQDTVKANLPKAVLEMHPGNEHEYRGIHKVWELGTTQYRDRQAQNDSRSDYIFYFHNRGVTRDRIDLGMYKVRC